MAKTTDFTNFANEHPNYFPGQYLLEDDFEIQHQYFSDRQRYHNQKLHISGIIEGLEVEVITGKKSVLIKFGSAIDGNGELIVVKKDITFSDFKNLANGELYIQFSQEKQVKQQEDVADSYTRWIENPISGFAATSPANSVKLAKLTISGDTITLDTNVREYSGLSLPNSNSKALTFRSGGNANPNLAVLTGSLKIDGDLTVNGSGNSTFAGNLTVNGAANLGYESNISNFGNPMLSGFYQNGGTEITGDVPDTSHPWTHLIIARHSNINNNHQLQIAASYQNNDRLFFRKIALAGTTASNPDWNEVATRGTNVFSGAQTINNNLTVTGTGNSSFSGNLTVSGTISGKIDAGNITTGQLVVERIPNLPATKITSGELAVERIPNLSASKITSGTVSGDLTVSGNLTVTGVISGVLNLTLSSFKVAGDASTYYPVVFQDNAWSNGTMILEISRPNTHTDSGWRGSLISTFTCHSSNWGHGSEFTSAEIHQSTYFIASYMNAYHSANFIVWLKGGGTTYYWRSNHPVAVANFDTTKKVLANNETFDIKTTVDTDLQKTHVSKKSW
ncbi:MAG: polymer-forming cytoskeletal protein [Fischerella sp. CENA71]|nr:polymer-forming cytoskeletal protein [Fischerella sp. CENA71]